jgi:hypothetical protein
MQMDSFWITFSLPFSFWKQLLVPSKGLDRRAKKISTPVLSKSECKPVFILSGIPASINFFTRFNTPEHLKHRPEKSSSLFLMNDFTDVYR